MTQKNWPYLLVLSLSILLAYSNCLQNEFLWDDEFLIQKNSYLKSFEYLPKILTSNSTAGFGGKDDFYRPTQNLYYLFIYQLFGQSTVAFHLGNILLHILNSFLLFFLSLKLFSQPRLAFAASLLWALHPTHTEAITYISGTADPMATLFFLMSALLLPLKQSSFLTRQSFYSLLLMSLALLSKEALVVAPALLTLILFFKNKEPWKIRHYKVTLPFWLMTFAYLAARKTIFNFDKTFNFYEKSNIYTENIHYRLYTYLATLPEYLKILFWPIDLHMERSFPVFTSPSALPVFIGFIIFTVSLIISLFYLLKKKKRTVFFCWAWFFGSFVPMNGILLPVNSFILEHWLYLTSISLFLAFAFLLNLLEKLSSKSFWVALTSLSLCLSILTLQRNRDWKDPITFYSNILKYSDGSARVHNNIAMAFSDKKDWDKAIAHYEIALSTSDSYYQTHYNLARALIQTQNYPEAIKHLNQALVMNPQFTQALELKAQLMQFLRTNKSTQ